jgi:DNA-binding NarL/FixJ family response regulator
MKRARILLADDHTLMAEALQHLLQTEFEVVETVRDGRALVEAVSRLEPDLVVADIAMPLLNGLDAGDQIRAAMPRVKIVYLTQHRDPRYAAEAMRRHAAGYVLKEAAASDLIAAIRDALDGRRYVSPLIANQIDGGAGLKSAAETLTRDLTPREREVLQLLAEGKSMKEAAAILHISAKTVEFHKYRVMELLGAKTSAELVRHAIRQGLITA